MLKNKKVVIIASIVLILVLASIYLIFFNKGLTGNVVFSDDNKGVFKVGEILDIKIILDTDELDSPILLVLSKEDTIFKVDTLSPSEIKNQTLKTREIMNYKFNETGEYELLVSLLKNNFNLRQKISVE